MVLNHNLLYKTSAFRSSHLRLQLVLLVLSGSGFGHRILLMEPNPIIRILYNAIWLLWPVF